MKLTVLIDTTTTTGFDLGAREVARIIGDIADRVPVAGEKLPQTIRLQSHGVYIGSATFEATPGEYGEPP